MNSVSDEFDGVFVKEDFYCGSASGDADAFSWEELFDEVSYLLQGSYNRNTSCGQCV